MSVKETLTPMERKYAEVAARHTAWITPYLADKPTEAATELLEALGLVDYRGLESRGHEGRGGAQPKPVVRHAGAFEAEKNTTLEELKIR